MLHNDRVNKYRVCACFLGIFHIQISDDLNVQGGCSGPTSVGIEGIPTQTVLVVRATFWEVGDTGFSHFKLREGQNIDFSLLSECCTITVFM